jgi:serine/threonine protein phosphatase PrpC
VKAGWAITKGRRFYNEDQIYLAFHPLPHGGQEGTSGQVACLAVFDGHGGPVASLFVRDRLFDNLLKHDDFQTNLFKAVGKRDSF